MNARDEGPASEPEFEIIFKALEDLEDDELHAVGYQLPPGFADGELDGINELRRLSLALRQPEMNYFTRS